MRQQIAARCSRLLQLIATEQSKCGGRAFGTVYGEVRAHPAAALQRTAAGSGAAGSAGFSSAAWQSYSGRAFAQATASRGAAAASDSAPSAASALLHAAQLAGATGNSAIRSLIGLSAALQTVRQHSSLPGPPPNVPHRPQHTSKGDDGTAANGESTDSHETGGERHTAAQMLSQQLEDIHGPPPPAEDAVDAESPGGQSATSVAEAAALLQQVNVVQLREKLDRRSQDQPRMAFAELLQLCIDSGAATDQKEAQELAKALCATGVVLRFRNNVFLRPEEVMQSVLRALPDQLEELEALERQYSAQLAPLEERKQAVERAAHRRSKAVMWTGFLLLMGQWSLFYWLTWYELSWDVMEPVAYFVSLGTAIGFYLYFLLTNEAFDYQPLQNRLFSRWHKARLQADNFDHATYNKLHAKLSRFRRYIEHIKRA